MANTIRIKRRSSGNSGAPSTLKNSELAYNEVDDVLYYGRGADGSGDAVTIPAIAGPGAFTTLATAQTISGNKTFTGSLNFAGATIDTVSTTGNVTVGGNLVVNGTTTNLSSTVLEVEDKNIELGKVATPSDTTADGGGLSLLGASTKTFNWVNATDSWTSSENLDLASGKAFYINGTQVLDSSSLGSGVTGSSLTSVGTLSTGVWQGTAIGLAYGGTGATTAAGARTNLGLVVGTDVQAYDAELDTLSGMTSGAATALAALTGTEVAILDGALVTTDELNILDGGTTATATTLASSDRMVINDAGTMVQVALSDLVTFFEDGTASGFSLDGGTF